MNWRAIKRVEVCIDNNVINNFKNLVATFTKRKRKVIIAFDEVEIRKELEYNKANDSIDGFEDLGGGQKTSRFA